MNVLKKSMYILNGLILWYVNYISIKLLFIYFIFLKNCRLERTKMVA